MKIDDLLDKYRVKLVEYSSELWGRKGFYYPKNRTIFLNSDLAEHKKVTVILHEIGHMGHNPKMYKRLLLKYENEADRFMIKELIKDYLKENNIYDFDWLKFAEQYKISSTWVQEMIQNDIRKYM